MTHETFKGFNQTEDVRPSECVHRLNHLRHRRHKTQVHASRPEHGRHVGDDVPGLRQIKDYAIE